MNTPISQPIPQARDGAIPQARGGGRAGEPIRNLLEACLRMLKLTGGSQYWTGDTQAALEFMEAAVAEALQMGASRTPQNGESALVPEIVAPVAASMQFELPMVGVEA